MKRGHVWQAHAGHDHSGATVRISVAGQHEAKAALNKSVRTSNLVCYAVNLLLDLVLGAAQLL